MSINWDSERIAIGAGAAIGLILSALIWLACTFHY